MKDYYEIVPIQLEDGTYSWILRLYQVVDGKYEVDERQGTAETKDAAVAEATAIAEGI